MAVGELRWYVGLEFYMDCLGAFSTVADRQRQTDRDRHRNRDRQRQRQRQTDRLELLQSL